LQTSYFCASVQDVIILKVYEQMANSLSIDTLAYILSIDRLSKAPIFYNQSNCSFTINLMNRYINQSSPLE